MNKMDSALTIVNTKNDNKLEHELHSCTDDKVWVYETAISERYIKQEPHDTEQELENFHNYGAIKDEVIEDLEVVVQETQLLANIKENNLTCCEGCGEEYDLYCLKCPMLARVLNNSNSNLSDDSIEGTLPKNFVDMWEAQSGVGIVALRVIPKGVVFGPFQGLDKELAYARDSKWLNWMQYIQRVDQNSHSNLTPFQYEDELYYRSDCHIGVDDELLVRWDNIWEENATGETCQKPKICDSLDDVYACMLCCVGYKLICHLVAHNSRCPRKKDQNDCCEKIVQCAFCKIYMDKKEYSDYHVDRCFQRNRKIFDTHQEKKQGQRQDFDHQDVKHFARIQRPHKTRTKQQLKQKILNHTDDRPFACSLCPYKTKTNSLLKLHLSTHNDDKPFECSLCSFKTKTSSRLKEHIATHYDDKPFACTRCPFKTKTNRQLKRHIATHNDDRPFACTLCSYKAKSNLELKLHIAIHNDEKPFACTQCPFKTKTNKRLKLHVATHSDDKPLACSFCSFKTTTNTRLRAHIVIHSEDKPFACDRCPYKTTIKWRLKRHIAIHNDDKLFSCPICSYKTKRQSKLELHVAVHNGDKLFACAHCPYITKTNSQLKEHVVVHNDDKPFACSLCTYKTRTNSYLKKHMAKHNDALFACPRCSYKTKIDQQLKEHIATHNDDTPYV